MPVRGVIFDMGGTLLHYNAPNAEWEDTEKLGAAGVYKLLRKHGYTLLPEDEALDLAWDHAQSLWLTLLDKYDIRYVYVGPLERERYPSEGLAKFAEMMGTVYESSGVVIYKR